MPSNKTISYTISEQRLKSIIDDEIRRFKNENSIVESNSIDHEQAAKVSTASSKLLKACADFKEKALGGMLSAVAPHLDVLVNALEQMVSNPANYTDKVKVEPKRVSLRAVKQPVKK